MNGKRSRIETITRYQAADLARRGHALAEATSPPAEETAAWWRDYEIVRQAVERIKNVALLNEFANASEPDEADDDDDDGYDDVRSIPRTRNRRLPMSASRAGAIEYRSRGLDLLVNGDCDFDAAEVPNDELSRFMKVALAVAHDRLVRFDDICRMRPDLSQSTCTRYAAALLDAGLSQTLYHDVFHVFPDRCRYWLEEHGPMKATGDVVHGDKIEVGTGVAIARGGLASRAIVQDNRNGGTGSIEASDADLEQFFTALVAEVNERADAPEAALVAAARAKAAAKSKEPGKALAALRKGGGWLLGIAKDVAIKVGHEYILQKLGITT